MKKINVFVLIISLLALAGVSFLFVTMDLKKQNNIGAAGDTYSTKKIAQKGLTNATQTPVSLLNNSDRDRIVLGVFMYLEGADTQYSNPASNGYDPTVSTSSNPYYNSNANLNHMAEWVNIHTTSPSFIWKNVIDRTESTTLGWDFTSTASAAPIWPSGSYLNFNFATSLASTTSGFMGVEYLSE